jgi:hypothetical protein
VSQRIPLSTRRVKVLARSQKKNFSSKEKFLPSDFKTVDLGCGCLCGHIANEIGRRKTQIPPQVKKINL